LIPFAAYTAAETSHVFQWVGQPQKLPIPVERSRPPSNTWFLGPTAHPSPNRQAQRDTDRQTTLRVTLCCNRPHLCNACDAI